MACHPPRGSEAQARQVWLRPDAALRVAYDDRTPFGSPVSGRPNLSTRRLFGPVVDRLRRKGYGGTMAVAQDLLAASVDGEAFRSVTIRDDRGGWELRPEVAFPDPDLAPAVELTVGDVRVPVGLERWPAVHALVAELRGPGHHLDGGPQPDEIGRLVADLDRHGLLTAEPPPRPEPLLVDAPLTFVGHNTVVVRSGSHAVVLDPLLMPQSTRYPSGYQPLALAELGPIDAVVVTHSHFDHFNLGSLLQFPPSTTLVVPRVERESLLTIDMARRARELGFTDVREVGWWESVTIGDIDVHAMPFFGEQPTDGEVLHPEVRNHGNTYVVRAGPLAAAFLADSGRDQLGDSVELASVARARLGPVDAVFSGYRSWAGYPVQLLSSTLARYLLLVPPWRWSCRQRIMNGTDDALDIAERWGARRCVPYADGGAPWFWEQGLGPRLDEPAPEIPGFDPLPERVLEAAAARATTPAGDILTSPVDVALLRPGDSLLARGGVGRVPGHAWPWGDQGAVDAACV